MIVKSNIIKLTVLTVLMLSFLYIYNFVADKKDVLANINNKQVVEVRKRDLAPPDPCPRAD